MSGMLKPKSIEQLQLWLRDAPGKRRVTTIDLAAISGIRQHTPEDLTATVAAGTTLGSLQGALKKHGQWLPLDPPFADTLSIGALLAANWSGPRRFGLGTVRDYVIGMKVILADGSESNSGGQVVKNVAGFDLPRLFVGSRGSLGVIVEATFKLGPLPEAEAIFVSTVDSADELVAQAQQVLEARLSPTILDGHNMGREGQASSQPRLVVGFSGSQEDVEYQSQRLQSLLSVKKTKLDYADWAWRTGKPVNRTSVKPSELGPELIRMASVPWVARVGNGVVYDAGTKAQAVREPRFLETRLKHEFDPEGILPPIPETA